MLIITLSETENKLRKNIALLIIAMERFERFNIAIVGRIQLFRDLSLQYISGLFFLIKACSGSSRQGYLFCGLCKAMLD